MEHLISAGVVIWLVVLFIAILWILMPFAIFGTKPLLRQLLKEQKRTNDLLQAQADRAKAIRDQAAALRAGDAERG